MSPCLIYILCFAIFKIHLNIYYILHNKYFVDISLQNNSIQLNLKTASDLVVLCRILTLFMTRILFLCYRRIDLAVDRYTSRTGKCFYKISFIYYISFFGRKNTYTSTNKILPIEIEIFSKKLNTTKTYKGRTKTYSRLD